MSIKIIINFKRIIYELLHNLNFQHFSKQQDHPCILRKKRIE